MDKTCQVTVKESKIALIIKLPTTVVWKTLKL